MYFPELDTLRARSLGRPALLEALDKYLERLGTSGRSSLNPRIIAQELRITLPDAIALLEAGVELGIFRHRFHVMCRVEQAGVAWFDSIAEMPELVTCDICEEGPHELRPEEIEVRYALVSERVPASR